MGIRVVDGFINLDCEVGKDDFGIVCMCSTLRGDNEEYLVINNIGGLERICDFDSRDRVSFEKVNSAKLFDSYYVYRAGESFSRREERQLKSNSVGKLA